MLILQKKNCCHASYYYRIINSNGIEVEQCGNGARCIAYYLFIIKKIKKNKICVRTKNRYLYLEHVHTNVMKVDMGKPIFSPEQIPFLDRNIQLYYSINIDKIDYKVSVVSMGNPHCVILVNDIEDLFIKKIAHKISTHSLFPQEVNVGFMKIISKTEILLKVYERGVGETKSCGTGACAAVVIGIRNKLLYNRVRVYLPGGKLIITWTGCLDDEVYMSGEAAHVYDGRLKY